MKIHYEVKMRSKNPDAQEWFLSSYHEDEADGIGARDALRHLYRDRTFELFCIETTETVVKEGK